MTLAVFACCYSLGFFFACRRIGAEGNWGFETELIWIPLLWPLVAVTWLWLRMWERLKA